MRVALMVVAFIWWWPVGLAMLAFLIGRRRLGFVCGQMLAGDGGMRHWSRHADRWEHKLARAQEKVDRMRSRTGRYGQNGDWFTPRPASSGNAAFDDYRAETLRRLEDEQREFKDFLERLRVAKDRAEFDQFMADRRQRPAEPDAESDPPRT